MKSIGRTIDRILKVDPMLAEHLDQIKAKSQRYPSKATAYWRELLAFLNSDQLRQHPKRGEIAGIVSAPRKRANPVYTFDSVAPGENILGVVPEHMADYVRRHDVKTIKLAKMQVEANMTRNTALMARIAREETLLDISVKKMWLMLKDHFGLWDKTASFSIKKNGGATLVMVELPPQQGLRPRVLGPFGPDDLRRFFMLGPPDGDQGQP